MVATSIAIIGGLIVPGLVSATTGSGGSTSILLAQGQTRTDVTIKPREGSDVVTAQNTYPPGSDSGWHSHPGIAVVTVQAGQITLYRERVGGGSCRVHTYRAGDTFFEWRADEENGVNRGSATTVVFATFFGVPHGGSARIDRADPGDCPA